MKDAAIVFAGFILASLAIVGGLALGLIVAAFAIIVRLIPLAIAIWLVWMLVDHMK